MALKYNLASSLMSPEQRYKMGESFGEGAGGLLGVAAEKASDWYNKPPPIMSEEERRIAPEIESEEEDFDDIGDVEELQYDEVDEGNFRQWDEWDKLGPEERHYSGLGIEQGRHRAQRNWEKQQREAGVQAAADWMSDERTEIMPKKDNLFDHANLGLGKIGGRMDIPETLTTTTQDIETYKAQGGDYDALSEKRLRAQDPGMYSGASYSYDRKALGGKTGRYGFGLPGGPSLGSQEARGSVGRTAKDFAKPEGVNRFFPEGTTDEYLDKMSNVMRSGQYGEQPGAMEEIKNIQERRDFSGLSGNNMAGAFPWLDPYR